MGAFAIKSWVMPILAAALLFFAGAAPQAAEYHVDGNNTTGTEDGTVQHPFTAIQEAVDAAEASGGTEHTLRVAQGDYSGNVVIDAMTVHLLGGFEGGSTADYAGGAGGLFAVQDPDTFVTRIQGDGTSAAVALFDAGTSTVDGFTITGGTGLADPWSALGGGVYVYGGSPTISDNSIEGNDVRHEGLSTRGGGIAAQESDITITGNQIRNNIAYVGGGIATDGGSALIQGNTIQANTADGDHGGGLYLTGNPVVVTQNRILENESGRSLGYGWGGGIVVLGEETSAVLSFNLYQGNWAHTAGGGVFIDDGSTAQLNHELIENNTCAERGGAGLYVDGAWDEIGSTCTLSHCTLADNHCSGCTVGGYAILVEYYSDTTVQDSIIWGNGGDDYNVDATSQLTVSYTDSQELAPGTGNISQDPLFANSPAGDYHLQSTAGRYDPAAGGGIGDWVQDPDHSPCIDTADPASNFSSEPAPNGARANMGRYGDTTESSLSPSAGCPACDGPDVAISSYTYGADCVCDCSAASSITIGPDVTMEDRVRVTLTAPEVFVKSGVTVKPGAQLNIKQ